MRLRLTELLLLTLIQGEIITVLSFPNNQSALLLRADTDEYAPEPLAGYVSTPLTDAIKMKTRRIIRKRSAGRAVEVPKSIVDSMANVPFSALSTDLPNIQQEILDTHNKYRRMASPSAGNMLKLTWSDEAAVKALWWAKKCQPGHSTSASRQITNFKTGENTMLFPCKIPWETVIGAWYSECPDFTYGQEPPTVPEVGHFTQMMWATSQKVGCGVAECPSQLVYVCHYGPAGNKGGKAHPWKEGKPCEACPGACDDKLCTNPCPYQDWYGNCPDFLNTCKDDPTLRDKNCPGTCGCTKGEIK